MCSAPYLTAQISKMHSGAELHCQQDLSTTLTAHQAPNDGCQFFPPPRIFLLWLYTFARFWIIHVVLLVCIYWGNCHLQRQSEDYDDYDYDGPTQDPISAQLGLVADSNRCPKVVASSQPRTLFWQSSHSSIFWLHCFAQFQHPREYCWRVHLRRPLIWLLCWCGQWLPGGQTQRVQRGNIRIKMCTVPLLSCSTSVTLWHTRTGRRRCWSGASSAPTRPSLTRLAWWRRQPD